MENAKYCVFQDFFSDFQVMNMESNSSFYKVELRYSKLCSFKQHLFVAMRLVTPMLVTITGRSKMT